MIRDMSFTASSMLRAVALFAGISCCLTATVVHADPCTAALPAPGTRFTGTVRHVIDGDGLCVGPAGRPDRWIEIRLADFYAPESREAGGRRAKARLAALTMGRTLTCVAGHRSYDRIVARCMMDGRPIGSWLRAEGGREGGRGFRHR